MDQNMSRLMNDYIQTGEIQLVKTTNGQKKYSCVNQKNNNFISNILFTSDMEVLYIECNGYSNKKYGRGESLGVNDVRAFVHEALYSEPIVQKSRLFKRQVIILGDIKLNMPIAE